MKGQGDGRSERRVWAATPTLKTGLLWSCDAQLVSIIVTGAVTAVALFSHTPPFLCQLLSYDWEGSGEKSIVRSWVKMNPSKVKLRWSACIYMWMSVESRPHGRFCLRKLESEPFHSCWPTLTHFMKLIYHTNVKASASLPYFRKCS